MTKSKGIFFSNSEKNYSPSAAPVLVFLPSAKPPFLLRDRTEGISAPYTAKDAGSPKDSDVFFALFYSLTGTGRRSCKLSGVTAQSMASTVTPPATARRSASPKAGWVASLGAKSTMPPICTTKQTAAS